MKYTMTFAERQYEELLDHLWTDRSTERAAYLLCRLSRTETETRLLVRSVWPVLSEDIEEASDVHMRISSGSFLRVMKQADGTSQCFVFVHSHPDQYPHHSHQDDQTERPLFRTAYNRIHHEGVHGSLVFSARNRPVGRIWLADGTIVPIETVRVIGRRFRFYSEGPGTDPIPEFFDRQVRAFGEDTQRLLKRLTVGVVGLGGTGSAVVQQLVRLGVGSLTVSDGEDFDRTNVNRVYGSRVTDHDVAKAKIAERGIADIGLGTTVTVLRKPITFRSVLMAFRNCDVVFGCTDDEWGRSLLSRFAIYYAIPVLDMGVRIRSEEGVIESIQGRVTTLMPSRACLSCRKRITAEGVNAESLKTLDPAAYQRLVDEGYVPELGNIAPAVIPFTTSVAASAVNELLHRLTGHLGEERVSSEVLHLFGDTRLRTNDVLGREECYCGNSYYLNRGDAALFLDTTWRSE